MENKIIYEQSINKRGIVTFSCNGKLLYSAYNPQKEANNYLTSIPDLDKKQTIITFCGANFINDELDKKANITYVNSELNERDTQINLKSDKTYVDTELNKKSDKTYVDNELNKKANTAHTHTESDITDLQDYALNSDVYSKSEVDELIHNLQNNIKVNGTSGIIQSDESVELYAYTKADGMPVINKKVHFYQITDDEPADEETITSNE